jgi:hypothetical protein
VKSPIAPLWPCLAAACQPGRGDYIDMRRLRACPGSPGGENFQMVPQPPLPERAVNFHTLCSCAYMFPSESNVKGTPKSTPIYTHYRNPSATHSLAAGASGVFWLEIGDLSVGPN